MKKDKFTVRLNGLCVSIVLYMRMLLDLRINFVTT